MSTITNVGGKKTAVQSVRITVPRKSTDNAAKSATAHPGNGSESPPAEVSRKRPDKTPPKQGKKESRLDSNKPTDVSSSEPKVILEKGGPSEDKSNKKPRKSADNPDEVDPAGLEVIRKHRPRCDYCNLKGHYSSMCPTWYKGHGDTLYYYPPRQGISVPTDLAAALNNSENIENEVAKLGEEFESDKLPSWDLNPAMACLENQNATNGRLDQVGTPPHKSSLLGHAMKTKTKGIPPAAHHKTPSHTNLQVEKTLDQMQGELESMKQQCEKSKGMINDLEVKLKNTAKRIATKQHDSDERITVVAEAVDTLKGQKEPKAPRAKVPKIAHNGTAPTDTDMVRGINGKHSKSVVNSSPKNPRNNEEYTNRYPYAQGIPHSKAGTSVSILGMLPLNGKTWGSDRSESPPPMEPSAKEPPVWKKPDMALVDFPDGLMPLLAEEQRLNDFVEEEKLKKTIYSGHALEFQIEDLEEKEKALRVLTSTLHIDRCHTGTTAANGNNPAKASLPIIKERLERARSNLLVIQDKLETYREAYSAYQAEELEREARRRAYAKDKGTEKKKNENDITVHTSQL